MMSRRRSGVIVNVQMFEERQLPPVCVISGEPADAFHPHQAAAKISGPLRVVSFLGGLPLMMVVASGPKTKGWLPYSSAAARGLQRQSRFRLFAVVAFFGLLAAYAVVFPLGNIPDRIATVVAFGLFAALCILVVVVERRRPIAEVSGSYIEFSGVHENFARACGQQEH